MIRVKPRLIPGSSPLARGLQARGRRVDVQVRIIPARAGFTRGRLLRFHAGRIIPARAGFTVRWASMTPLMTDHPRSRGVYIYTIPGTE